MHTVNTTKQEGDNNMTRTNTDILGERTALERMIYDLQYAVDTRLDEGAELTDSLGGIGLSIEVAQERVRYLENILAKYRMLEKAAEQYKNPPNISARDSCRMLSSAQMIRSVRELLANVNLAEPSAMAINRGALIILDSAVEVLERND